MHDIFIKFGSKLYRQVAGFSMGTNCAPLVAALFFVMRDTSFLTIIKLMLAKLLTLPQAVYMTCFILIILILNKW